MSTPSLDILYEDNHLLAVAKPAGLPTMGTPKGKPTLLTVAKDYIKQRYDKPGNVYLGVVSRLDAPVTGVVLLARTSKAARRLTEQFRERRVRKIYWALVEGRMEEASGNCIDWVGHDERHRRMHIVGPQLPGAKEARLSYTRRATISGSQGVSESSMLEIELETGRKHQIRLQWGHRNHPILGDRKYGSHHVWPAGIALHARSLTITHPTLGQPLTLECPLPAAWRKFGVSE